LRELPASVRKSFTLLSENSLEFFKGSLTGYRHSEAGHIEEEEEAVTHTAWTASEHDETTSEPGTSKQRPETLPSKVPGQRSNVSHRFKLPSVNDNDGLALPIDASLQSEVSEPNEPLHPEISHLPRQRRTPSLHQKYLRALICAIVPLNTSSTANNPTTYVSSRTNLAHQGPTAAADTHVQTMLVRAMKETENIGRASSTLTMKAITSDAQ